MTTNDSRNSAQEGNTFKAGKRANRNSRRARNPGQSNVGSSPQEVVVRQNRKDLETLTPSEKLQMSLLLAMEQSLYKMKSTILLDRLHGKVSNQQLIDTMILCDSSRINFGVFLAELLTTNQDIGQNLLSKATFDSIFTELQKISNKPKNDLQRSKFANKLKNKLEKAGFSISEDQEQNIQKENILDMPLRLFIEKLREENQSLSDLITQTIENTTEE